MDSTLSYDADGYGQSAPSPDDAVTPSSPGPSLKRRRTAASATECCRTCRLRKVKCTGNPGDGPCSICARLELTCSFIGEQAIDATDKVSRTTPSASHTEAGTLRKRAQRACNQCHQHKTKCSGDMPRCKRCESANLPCEYTPTRRKFTNVRFQNQTSPPADDVSTPASGSQHSEEKSMSPHVTSRTGVDAVLAIVPSLTAEETLNRRDFLLRSLDIYFDVYFWMPCMGFLHPKLAYQEVQNMTFHPIKGAAVCGLAAFVLRPGQEGQAIGDRCFGVVEAHVFGSINSFTEDSFFVTCMNTLFQLLSGNYAKVWVCMGFLHRQMTGLRANWLKHDDHRPFTHLETLRRLAWHVFYLDRLLADGYDEYISCRSDHMRIRLPCTSEYFLENRSVETEWLLDKPVIGSPNLGIHGWQMRIVDLRHRILVLAKKLAEPGNLSSLGTSAVMMDINSLQNELSRLHLSFPDSIKLSKTSIEYHMAAPERMGYVFLHSHVGVAHIELYSFALPQLRESSPELLRKLPQEFVIQSQRQAIAHSLSVARFVVAVHENFSKSPAYKAHGLAGDYSVTHMTTRAIRVLLVALEHDLYHDIAAYTTAPPWSNGAADKAEIESLLIGMLNATEAWSRIYSVTKIAHDGNKAMIDDFFRTRTFIDRKIESAADAKDYLGGSDGMNDGDKIIKEGSPSEQWHYNPAQPSSSGSSVSPYSPPGTLSEPSYVPPGVPTFLESVQRSEATWSMSEMSGLLLDIEETKPPRNGLHKDRAGIE